MESPEARAFAREETEAAALPDDPSPLIEDTNPAEPLPLLESRPVEEEVSSPEPSSPDPPGIEANDDGGDRPPSSQTRPKTVRNRILAVVGIVALAGGLWLALDERLGSDLSGRAAAGTAERDPPVGDDPADASADAEASRPGETAQIEILGVFSGTRVYVDGALMDSSTFELPKDGRPHEILVLRHGFRPWRHEIVPTENVRVRAQLVRRRRRTGMRAAMMGRRR